MRYFVLFFSFLLVFNITIAQKIVQGVSETKFVNVTKDPPKPPYIEITKGSLQFFDEDGNFKIDANESAYIGFELSNTGMGPGLNLNAVIKETTNANGLHFNQQQRIGTLEKGETIRCKIPIKGKMDIASGNATFKIRITETNGFGTDPYIIEIETQAFKEPDVKVVDYLVSSQDGNTLMKKRPFNVQVLIQNVGQGRAEKINLSVPVPDNIFCLTSNNELTIESLKPGEKQLIEYKFVTNNNFNSSSILFDFKINEKYGRFAKDKLLELTMNQSVATEKLVIEGLTEEDVQIAIGSLSSEVDKNIPYVAARNPNRIALVIGNEDYSRSLDAEINVDYARNDAEIFSKYCINILGVEERNMHLLYDATVGIMEKEIELVAELLKRLGPEAELIFYYAGHGYPAEDTKAPYLIPVDVNASNIYSAIKLSEVYKKFGESGAKRVSVFLDACFSGGGRNQGLLAARGAVIKPGPIPLFKNMVVFAASSGKQSSLPLHDEKHGMFTFYLLSKLKETKGQLLYGELADYLKKKVSVESLRINQKPQDPEVLVDPSNSDKWDKWKF